MILEGLKWNIFGFPKLHSRAEIQGGANVSWSLNDLAKSRKEGRMDRERENVES